jgi:hypothetical protein
MPRLVGTTPGEKAAEQTRFVAQLYVARKKVWEGRANSHEEASNMAKQEKAKYPGARSTVVIKEAKWAD